MELLGQDLQENRKPKMGVWSFAKSTLANLEEAAERLGGASDIFMGLKGQDVWDLRHGT